jgi:hypothetical protein
MPEEEPTYVIPSTPVFSMERNVPAPEPQALLGAPTPSEAHPDENLQELAVPQENKATVQGKKWPRPQVEVEAER